MTDAELEGIAAQACNMAKRDLDQIGFNFLLAAYHDDEHKLHRMDSIEALIIERLGEDWLNSGKAKDAAFQMLRVAVDLLPPDAFVFVCIANGFSPTAKFYALPKEKQAEILQAGHDRHHLAVKEGLFEVCDILAATAQTPERVCMYNRKLDRRTKDFAEEPPQSWCVPQEQFGGRMKMFGEDHVVQ